MCPHDRIPLDKEQTKLIELLSSVGFEVFPKTLSLFQLAARIMGDADSELSVRYMMDDARWADFIL